MLRTALSLILSILTFSVSSFAQNLIEIQLPEKSREALKANQKVEIKDDVSVKFYNRGTLMGDLPITIETRGQTSIKMPRKNYSIKGHKGSGLEKTILSAGSMDPLNIKNRISYEILQLAQVPSLETHLSEVIINQEHQGLYMITQAPEDFILANEKENFDVVLRRRYDDQIELKKAKKETSPEQIETYIKELRSLHINAKKKKGAELMTYLESRLDLKAYFRMLSANYILQNGDSADEVFFAGKRLADGSLYFVAVPWDLDDTFSEAMHMSNIPLNFNSGSEEISRRQMIYGFESRLDRAISENPQLLLAYLTSTKNLLETISAEKIEAIFEKVERKLLPYLDNPQILAAGLLDKPKAAYVKSEVLADISSKKMNLLARIDAMKKDLQDLSPADMNRAHKNSTIKNFFGNLFQKIMFQTTQPKPNGPSNHENGMNP